MYRAYAGSNGLQEDYFHTFYLFVCYHLFLDLFYGVGFRAIRNDQRFY